MTLGEKIKEARKQAGLSQEQFAEKMNVSRSAVAKWETDGGIPDRDNLKRLSEKMNVSVDELHRIIKRAGCQEIDLDVNITPEVIAALESYGYRVLRPESMERGKEK